jgi:hypothetical protein
MQPGGDLEHAWIMSDHVKRVAKWTTMACHVYDGTYQRVISITCCDFQFEDKYAQVFFRHNLNHVMARHGIPKPHFKGFMELVLLLLVFCFIFFFPNFAYFLHCHSIA